MNIDGESTLIEEELLKASEKGMQRPKLDLMIKLRWEQAFSRQFFIQTI